MNGWKTALCVLALSGSAWAQEEAPPLPLPSMNAEQDPRSEMLELFKKVELRLREIDDMLYDASAGGRGISDVEESGIGDLIKASLEGGETVLQDIDRIIEIAEQQGGS